MRDVRRHATLGERCNRAHRRRARQLGDRHRRKRSNTRQRGPRVLPFPSPAANTNHGPTVSDRRRWTARHPLVDDMSALPSRDGTRTPMRRYQGESRFSPMSLVARAYIGEKDNHGGGHREDKSR
jgi:hypothetical protein